MNNKELATLVYKHQLIQEIIKHKIAEPSLINRLIVQEVLREEDSPEFEKWATAVEIARREEPTKLNSLKDQIKNLPQDEQETASKFFSSVIKDTPDYVEEPTQSDESVIAKSLSTWIKSEMSDKIAPKIKAFTARIPIIGQATGIAQLLGMDPEKFVIEKLLSPIDNVIEILLEKTGADEIEKLLIKIIGREKLKDLIDAGGDKQKTLQVLKTLDFQDVMKNLLGVIVEQGGETEGIVREIINFSINVPGVGEAEIGRYLLGLLLGDQGLLDFAENSLKPETEQQPEVEEFYTKLAELEEKLPFAGATAAFEKLDAALLEGLLREFNNNPVYAKLLKELPENLKDKLQTAMESLNDREQEKVLAVLDQEGMIDLYVRHLESKITTPGQKPEETDAGTEEPNEQQIENAVQQGTNEQNISLDFDQSDPEVPNLRYDEYRNSLDWFFGMRDDKKTSFMKAFFLSFQVKLLHENLLASLNSIISPPEFGERALSRAADDLQEVTGDQLDQAISGKFSDQDESENIELSRKNKISLKRELADQADILLDAKKIAKAYISYGTQRSVDARFDGSSLEKQLKVVLGAVQMHNARLVSIMSSVASEFEKQQDVVKEQSEEELTRDQKIDKIEQVYKQMGNFYKNNLRISLENKDFKQATQAAKKMLEMIKPIIPFFPKTIVSNTTGKVISLADAVRNLEGKIESYKKVLRDIYMNIKDDEVSPIQISRALIQLKQLCESIDEEFNVPCQINETELKKAQGKLPPQEGALTDDPVEEEIPVVEPEPDTDTETGTNDQQETEPEGQEELAVEKFQISNPQAVNEFLKKEYGPNKFQDFTPEEYRTLIRLFVATKIEKELNEDYDTIMSLNLIDKDNVNVLNGRLYTTDRDRLKKMDTAKIKQFFKIANKIYKSKPFNVISDAGYEEPNINFNLEIMKRDFYEKITEPTKENLISTLEPIIEQMLRGKNG